jgi:hypothetical protein
MKMPPYLNASYEGDDLFTGDQIRELLAKQEQGEPVAWTLTETLEKKETTTTGHLWFSNPQNSSWTPLYTHSQPDQDEVDIRSRLYQRIHELETQLSKQEQEPVAYVNDDWSRIDFQSGKVPTKGGPLYTTPQQRKWVGLSYEEMKLIDPDGYEDGLPQQIQQALKEKNT